MLFIYTGQFGLKSGIFLYFLKNKDIIAQTLCVNREKPKSCCKGSCQLNKWLKKIDDTAQSEKNKTTPLIPEIFFSKIQENISLFSFNMNRNLFCKIFEFPIENPISLSKGHASDLLKPPIL